MAFAHGADYFDPRRGLVICLVLFVGVAGAAHSLARSRRHLEMSEPHRLTDWQVEFQVPTRWRFIGETTDSLGAEVRVYQWMDSELRVRRQVAGADITAAETCRLVLKQHATFHELQALFRQQVQDVDIAGRQGARVEGRLSVPGWPEYELKVLVAALAMETAAGQHEVYSVDIFTFGRRQGANDAVWRAVVDSMKVTGGGA